MRFAPFILAAVVCIGANNGPGLLGNDEPGKGDDTVVPVNDSSGRQVGWASQDGSTQVTNDGSTGDPGESMMGLKKLLQFLLRNHIRCVEVKKGDEAHVQLQIDEVSIGDYQQLGETSNNVVPGGT